MCVLVFYIVFYIVLAAVFVLYLYIVLYIVLYCILNRLRWYGHVLRKDDEDWVKKCMEHEVEGSRPRGRPKKTWKKGC